MVDTITRPPVSPVSPAVSAPTTKTPDAQVSQNVPEVKQENPKSEELLKRMAEAKPVEVKTEEMSVSNLESETDPKVKEKIVNLEKHYNKKYMELAEKIKQTEAERMSLNNWTPEKIEEVTRNPQFVQAAQIRLQQQAASQAPPNWQGSQEEWSALTPSEKQHIDRSISAVDAKVNNLLAQQEQLLTAREDELIKTRIPEYDPKTVDQLAQQIQSGQITRAALRELMYKAMSFDKSVERMYQLGREDRNGDIQGKIVASSPALGSATTQGSAEIPVKEANESPQNWFRRVAQFRLAEAKKAGNFPKKS